MFYLSYLELYIYKLPLEITSGHCGFLEDVSLTFIDKTPPSDLLKREDYWRNTPKTMEPFGLNILRKRLAVLLPVCWAFLCLYDWYDKGQRCLDITLTCCYFGYYFLLFLLLFLSFLVIFVIIVIIIIIIIILFMVGVAIFIFIYFRFY